MENYLLQILLLACLLYTDVQPTEWQYIIYQYKIELLYWTYIIKCKLEKNDISDMGKYRFW